MGKTDKNALSGTFKESYPAEIIMGINDREVSLQPTRIISRFSFRAKRLWTAACASLALAACQSIAPVPRPEETVLLHHYVLAHEDGFALDKERTGPITHRNLNSAQAQGDIELNIFTNGIDAYLKEYRQQDLVSIEPGPLEDDIELNNIFSKGIDAYLDALRVERSLQILVFVHGGLNGYEDDFDRMRRMLVPNRDCNGQSTPSHLFVTRRCPQAKASYYPIFVNWNSAFGDSILDDLFFLRGGDRQPLTALLTSPFRVVSRAVASVLDPLPVYYEFTREFKLDWGSWLFPVRVLMAPVVTGFGTPAWQIMYRRADLLTSPVLPVGDSRKKAKHKADEQIPLRYEVQDKYEGAAWSLLEALSKRITMSRGVGYWTIGNNRGIPVEITLVGHSMGAIVLNRLLTLIPELSVTLPVTNIIYLAPAASFLDTEMSVLPFLRANGRASLWIFTLASDDEAHELYWLPTERSVTDGLFRPVRPRGTLLTWIDSFLEPAMERGDYRVGSSEAFTRYYNRYGAHVFENSVEQTRDTRGQFNFCEWKAESSQRPTTHGQVGDPTHLEAVLSGVSPIGVFEPGVVLDKVDAKCTGLSIPELMQVLRDE